MTPITMCYEYQYSPEQQEDIQRQLDLKAEAFGY